MSERCKNCGACPNCGRRYDTVPYQPYPYTQPMYPWYQPLVLTTPQITFDVSKNVPTTGGTFNMNTGGSHSSIL